MRENKLLWYSILAYLVIAPLAVIVAMTAKRESDGLFKNLKVFPESRKFTALIGIELPNPIYVQGLVATDVNLKLTDGPGAVDLSPDGRWFWRFRPTADLAGKHYQVVLEALARGMKVPVICTFDVNVAYVNPPRLLGARNSQNPIPTLTSDVDNVLLAEQPGLNGAYNLELRRGGTVLGKSENPFLTYRPSLQDGIGMSNLQISYKPVGSDNYIQLGTFPIEISYPRLTVQTDTRLLQGEPLLVRAFLGPRDNMLGLDSGLQLVDTSGVFEPGVVNNRMDSLARSELMIAGDTDVNHRIDEYTFEFASSGDTTAIGRSGKHITVELRDPRTGQYQNVPITILSYRGH